MKRLVLTLSLLGLAACATTPVAAPVAPATQVEAGWTLAEASYRPVGLGLPGGAELAEGVRFVGGLELVAAAESPLHSLSDLKVHNGWVWSVSDAGDLVRFRLVEDARGGPAGMGGFQMRRLTLTDGQPITEKVDGDAEAIVFTPSGDLLVSFERNHRIWSYGPANQLTPPVPVASPNYAFPLNDGMEGVAAGPGGWRATGESGGVWDCTPDGCAVVMAPPEPLLADSDYRITSLDRAPDGNGWFALQRSFSPPIDARARIRRMAADGTLGPVLVELKLPGTTDNFEGLSVEHRPNGTTRLMILSDDNNSERQRTLLLVFDVTGG